MKGLHQIKNNKYILYIYIRYTRYMAIFRVKKCSDSRAIPTL